MSTSAFDKTIPYFVKAKTPEKLFRKFEELNTANGTNYNFYNIYFDGKDHVAWYWVRQKDIVKALIEKENQKAES